MWGWQERHTIGSAGMSQHTAAVNKSWNSLPHWDMGSEDPMAPFGDQGLAPQVNAFSVLGVTMWPKADCA